MICLTETWLDSRTVDESIQIDNYRLYRKDRGSRGGGVAIYIKNTFHSSLLTVTRSQHIEQLWINFKLYRLSLSLGVVYRPQSMSVVNFLDELEQSMISVTVLSKEIVCCGDFNINCLQPATAAYTHLSDFMAQFSLQQLVDEPNRVSRTSSTLLDLFLCNNKHNIVIVKFWNMLIFGRIIFQFC